MGRAKDVDAWFARYDNPMKDVVQRMREIILDVDPRVGECIKWQAPTFTFEGNIASFFPKSKQHASLMFHQGAKIPGSHAILEGGGATGRLVKIASVAEANARARELADVIRAWIALKSGGPAAKTAQKKTATKKGDEEGREENETNVNRDARAIVADATAPAIVAAATNRRDGVVVDAQASRHMRWPSPQSHTAASSLSE